MVRPRIFINTLKTEVKLNFWARNYSFFYETWQYSEQYSQFQLPRKIVAHYVVKFLYIFKDFTAAEFLHLG